MIVIYNVGNDGSEHGYFGTENPKKVLEHRDLNFLKRLAPELHLRTFKEWLEESGWKGETIKKQFTTKWGPQLSVEEVQKIKPQPSSHETMTGA
jgi:hypothetical protein